MPNTNLSDKEFLEKLTLIVDENISRESFGVSELAGEMGMSRSNLHRKVNKLTKISVSQYIRQARLKQAKKLLRQTSDTVSEVAYKVGFGSPSYFIKCFHDFYGYSPGEVGEREDKKKIATPVLFYKKRITIILSSVILLLGVFISFLLFTGGKSVPFNKKDPVVIADFKNLTEEKVFDKSLRTAFTTTIDQSRHVNVFSRKRMQETLKRMKEDSISFIDDELSREIAVREGINIYIVPEISKIGENYVLSGKILDAKTGNVYVSEVLYAKNRDEVLPKLDKLSRKIRHDLGESRYEIFEDGKPLSRVTTSSLEALKQYTLGVEKHLNLEFDDAATYYEQAILLDSGFTAAMASLGNILYERFDKEEGKEWLDKALVSIDNLTDKEKYSILAFYAANIDHDLNKAVEYTSLLGDLDPGNAVPHNNLGWYYQNLGIYDKCIEEYKTAINIDPDLILAYGGLIWNYLENFGRIDSALVWSEKMRARVPDNPWPYFYMGSAYVGLDSLVKAEEEFLKAKSINTGLTINNYRLALTYGLLGLYEESNEVLNEILRSDPNEVTAHFNLGLNYKMMGNRQDAGKQFLEGKKAAEIWVRQYPDDPVSYTSYGIALTCLGDRETGWEMGKKGIEIDSSSYINHVDLLVVQEKYNDALDYLEKALDHGYRDIVWIKMSPYISLLRDEDRYRELIEKYFD